VGIETDVYRTVRWVDLEGRQAFFLADSGRGGDLRDS